jgi:UDP-glucuronate 4-epimerase
MKRDFTCVDDIVSVLPTLLNKPPKRHMIYNLGNSAPDTLHELVNAVETACGQTAEKIILPQQPGDVRSTFSDTSAAKRDFGFAPTTNLQAGISAFVDWYRDWQNR